MANKSLLAGILPEYPVHTPSSRSPYRDLCGLSGFDLRDLKSAIFEFILRRAFNLLRVLAGVGPEELFKTWFVRFMAFTAEWAQPARDLGLEGLLRDVAVGCAKLALANGALSGCLMRGGR